MLSLSGCVKISLLNEKGKEIVLSFLRKGDFFGELTLLDEEPRSASAIATVDSSVFLLTRSRFYRLILTHHDMLRKILKGICTRLRLANKTIEGFAFLDVYERVERVLLQLSRNQGIRTVNGIEIVNAPTHQQLADIVGASRETITRVVAVLKKHGIIISYKERRLVLKEYTGRR
ncbi:MAG: Crp/Fnr family transcriptional regulator [Candidatus Loosdrechtia sp.]|uniref:Crp/Fnr family transcriptional regulator n=1 Tax=Candidatus Loosdrechtia sp. TaxID=3101272 RepID=UPI003A6462D1|nr:MAG: Crp/Fnr family transcriptional regulator [Candidatus Jettenia sp. AMX2]